MTIFDKATTNCHNVYPLWRSKGTGVRREARKSSCYLKTCCIFKFYTYIRTLRTNMAIVFPFPAVDVVALANEIGWTLGLEKSRRSRHVDGVLKSNDYNKGGERRSQKRIVGFIFSDRITEPWASLAQHQHQNSLRCFFNHFENYAFNKSPPASNVSRCASVKEERESSKRKRARESEKEHVRASVKKSLMSLPYQYLRHNEKHAKYVLLAAPKTVHHGICWKAKLS